jgi:hypothetical protein
MKTLNLRPLQIIGLVLACQMILLLSGSGLLAQAQEPAPFQISIIPAADHAVSGQPFTYTVVITNVSDAAIEYASVSVDVPQGTRLLQTKYGGTKWFGGNLPEDPEEVVDQIEIFTPYTVEANEVFTLQMIVEVTASPPEKLTLVDYNVTSLKDNAQTAGSPVDTEVRAPTATPTVIPTITPPSPTIQSATATRVPIPQTIASANTTTSTNSESDENDMSSQPLTENGLSTIIFLAIIAITVLAGAFVGIFWLLKKR